MKTPGLSPNEDARIEDLYSYDILDTEPEISFDSITELAAIICDVPVALVSLVDKDRQWFKSAFGFDGKETPRDVSFCGHSILQDEIFEVPNAKDDDRFHDNPLVTDEPKIVFYAGYPLKTPRGHNVGTLCLIDFKTKTLTDKQRRALQTLGQQVISQMELKKINSRLFEALSQVDAHHETILFEKEKNLKNFKAATLGYLAGGIAHEVNNPLSTITMANMTLKRHLKIMQAPDTVKKPCEIIDISVQRISKIIKGLHTISRDGSKDPMQEANLNEIVENTASICQAKFKSTPIQMDIEGEVANPIFCRSGQISQILVNLILNAYQAVQGTENPWIRIKVSDESDRCVLSVIDSGKGIQNHEDIMLPFFTTKEVGQGAGLGLSIAKAIAEDHGGDLVYCRASNNTKFDLILPYLSEEQLCQEY